MYQQLTARNQTLRELGFSNPLRSTSATAKDGVVAVASNTPTDTNAGKASPVKSAFDAAFARIHLTAASGANRAQTGVKRSASSELLKIDGLKNYIGACTQYEKGLEMGFSKKRLLRNVDEWKRRDGSA